VIASPCIEVCRMENGLCVGCLRTLDEITVWSTADDAQRLQILDAVRQRRATNTLAAH
jgi:predicted Fe-S protein YdhL (DUF1289 family)